MNVCRWLFAAELCLPASLAFFLCMDPLKAQTRWALANPQLPVVSATVATYDSSLQRAVVVALSSNEAWAVASQTGVWTQLSISGSGPGWLTAPSLTHDPLRGRAVLFGGATFAGTPQNGTVELVGNVWQLRNLASSPPPRHGAGLCFDAATGVIRLAGGDGGVYASTVVPLGDSWRYDGVQWTEEPASARGPFGLTSMVFDSRRSRCVALASNGTFEWSGAGFVAVPTATTPPPRGETQLIYDALRERVVLYGGRSLPGSSFSDLWEYDGATWEQRLPLGISVPPLHAAGMVFDPVLEVVRVFAGVSMQTFGAGTTSFLQISERRYEAVAPASGLPFANTCGATPTVPELPWLDDVARIMMPLLTPAAPALMAVGFSSTTYNGMPLPLPLDPYGFVGCDLLVAPDMVLSPVAISSAAEFVLAIPNQAQLLGLTVFAQGFELIAGRASSGLRLRIGGR